MTDKLYLITPQKIAELIANAKDYNAEKIAMLLQSLPMVDSEPVVYRCADCKTPLMPGYDCGSCGSFAAEEIEETPHTSPQALADRGIAETCAEICRSRSRSISADGHNAAAANEASKCALAIESHWQTYPSKALTPITADDVTDEMINDCLPHWMMSSISDVREIFVQIYNAVIKHRSFLK